MGYELWPPDLKSYIVGTPFEAPIRSGETDQAPELCFFSTDPDKIWCVHWVDVDLYQISSKLVEKYLSYPAFRFYYEITTLLHFKVRRK